MIPMKEVVCNNGVGNFLLTAVLTFAQFDFKHNIEPKQLARICNKRHRIKCEYYLNPTFLCTFFVVVCCLSCYLKMRTSV